MPEGTEPAAVRPGDGAVPIRELVEAAQLLDDRIAGADVEVVGVGQLDLTVDVHGSLNVQRTLDGALGAHVHEHRRFGGGAVGTGEVAAAGVAWVVMTSNIINSLSVKEMNMKITEAEEPVARFDRLLIGGQHMFPSCQSGSQHDEGGFGQVEVGDEGVQALEPVAGVDEDIGPPGLHRQRPILVGEGLSNGAGKVVP